MTKISAVVNTYNAERYLDKTLSRLHGFDEIVVCDMESNDSTIEIAQRHGCKIVTFPKGKTKYVEPARTFAINSASSEWVLVVDADEIVTDELHDYLYTFIEKGSNDIAGLWIPRRNFFMGRYMPCYYPDYILRFLKKDGLIWPETVHSIPTVKGRTVKIPRRRKDLAFIHLADDSYYNCIRKMNEYTENERIRRASRYSFIQFFYAPFFRFFKSYILKGGFRAGKPGFIVSMFDAIYHFNILAKMEEDRQNTHPHKDIDKFSE
ncbi:MAG: glycosyltransferase family 2 protein [Muribaculaceae bacterium]|nr:glycosyltransferase family 2 protein [Muribaculaceae bacterium]